MYEPSVYESRGKLDFGVAVSNLEIPGRMDPQTYETP